MYIYIYICVRIANIPRLLTMYMCTAGLSGAAPSRALTMVSLAGYYYYYYYYYYGYDYHY